MQDRKRQDEQDILLLFLVKNYFNFKHPDKLDLLLAGIFNDLISFPLLTVFAHAV